MDHKYYSFMEKSKNDANRAIVESLQLGYLLCQKENGSIDDAQFESLLSGLASIGGKVGALANQMKSAFKAAALAGTIAVACTATGCSTAPKASVDVDTAPLDVITKAIDQGMPVTNQDLANLGQMHLSEISADVQAQNDRGEDLHFTDLDGWKALVRAYRDIESGAIHTDAYEAARQNNDKAGMEKAVEQACGALIAPFNRYVRQFANASDLSIGNDTFRSAMKKEG